MRKIIFTGLALLFISIGLWAFYRFYLPNSLAKAIIHDSPPAYLPEKYKNEIERLHKPVTLYGEKVLTATDSVKGVSLELLLKAIDNVDPDQVMNVYLTLENKNVTDSDEVFDVIVREVKVNEFDINIYRPIFVKHATPQRINKLLHYIDQNKLFETIAPSTAKSIAKQLVQEHYEKVHRTSLKK